MRTRLLIPLAAAALTGALGAEIYLHPSWNAKARSDWVLCALPATYEIAVEGGRGGGRPSLHRQESEVVEAQLTAYVVHALRVKGWTVSDEAFQRRDMAEDKELLYFVSYLRERHATLAQRIMTSPSEMKAGQVSFGEPISELKPYTKADVLVFVHVEGFRYTAVRRILSFAGLTWRPIYLDPDVFRGPRVRIRVSFVETATGEVLCFLRPKGTGESGFLKDLDKLPRGAGSPNGRQPAGAPR